MTAITSVPERVYQRVITWADRDPDSGCLVSRYSLQGTGYSQIGWVQDGRLFMTTTHRALWVYLEGPTSEDETIDHTCKNRRCVERGHLRLLSNYDNARRTFGRDWPLGQCINGHPDSHQVERRDGGRTRRRCLLCERLYNKRKQDKRKHERKMKMKASTTTTDG